MFFLATTQTSPPFPPCPPRRGRPMPPLPPRTYRRRLSTRFPYCRQKRHITVMRFKMHPSYFRDNVNNNKQVSHVWSCLTELIKWFNIDIYLLCEKETGHLTMMWCWFLFVYSITVLLDQINVLCLNKKGLWWQQVSGVHDIFNSRTCKGLFEHLKDHFHRVGRPHAHHNRATVARI